MAKIDEIAELIINELEQFNKSSNKLATKLDSLKTQKINIDTSNLEKLIMEQNENNRLENIKNENQILEFQNKISKTVAVPKWMLFLVTIFFIVTITNSIIRLYESNNYKKKEKMAYERGINMVKDHFQSFIKDNPKVKQIYNKWKKQK